MTVETLEIDTGGAPPHLVRKNLSATNRPIQALARDELPELIDPNPNVAIMLAQRGRRLPTFKSILSARADGGGHRASCLSTGAMVLRPCFCSKLPQRRERARKQTQIRCR